MLNLNIMQQCDSSKLGRMQQKTREVLNAHKNTWNTWKRVKVTWFGVKWASKGAQGVWTRFNEFVVKNLELDFKISSFLRQSKKRHSTSILFFTCEDTWEQFKMVLNVFPTLGSTLVILKPNLIREATFIHRHRRPFEAGAAGTFDFSSHRWRDEPLFSSETALLSAHFDSDTWWFL